MRKIIISVLAACVAAVAATVHAENFYSKCYDDFCFTLIRGDNTRASYGIDKNEQLFSVSQHVPHPYTGITVAKKIKDTIIIFNGKNRFDRNNAEGPQAVLIRDNKIIESCKAHQTNIYQWDIQKGDTLILGTNLPHIEKLQNIVAKEATVATRIHPLHLIATLAYRNRPLRSSHHLQENAVVLAIQFLK